MTLPERGDSPLTIPQVMERYRMSECTALVCGDERVTYRELITDARRIASGLIRAGVQKGDRVVLSMDRGIGYVKAWLGVLYAGAAQISFHRGWPKDLVSLAAEECRSVCSIDEACCRRLLTSPLLPELEERLGSLKGSDLFQIIYTSGSTGKPKGVMNSHLTAVSQTLAAEENCLPGYFVRHCRRMLLDCSPGFVLSSYCLCVCLLNEKTVILAGKEEVRTPSALAECAQRHRADTVHVTPSWFLQNRNEPVFARMVQSTKLLLCGGEVVSPAAARIITKAAGGEVIFCYGASELFGPYLFSFGSAFNASEVSFLLPEAGADAFVLDDQGQMVKPGEQGEVCVGGIPAALGGYYNDFALTKQRFRTHPKLGRLYMTGDCARVTGDGKICFLGRRDLMVKVFGMRVELEAIERAMMEAEGVSLAAARVLGEGNQARIWAWYCGSEKVQERELRRHLSQTLPSYMVPDFFIRLNQMPLNDSGKLDRRALDALSKTGFGHGRGERVESGADQAAGGADQGGAGNTTQNDTSYGTILEALDDRENSEDIALIFKDTSISFAAMTARAKSAARALVCRGVLRGDRIVISAQNPVDQILGSLAILYAGACFVSVDPDWPMERREFISRDSGAVLAVDGTVLKRLEEEGGSCPLPKIRPDDAYAVYYSSGSTGKPKGCVIHHATCMGMVMPLKGNAYFHLEEQACSRIFVMGNHAYAGTYNNILLSLFCGKTLILADAGERSVPSLAGTCMLRHHVDGMLGTPSMLIRFLEDPVFREAVSKLRCLGLTGEALSVSDGDRILENVSGPVYDIFGTSEVYAIAGGRVRKGEKSALEYATPGAKLYVLSEDGQKVPEGEAGEFCVGGIQARYGCYLGRPDLTKEKYEEHPSYGRIYHTGDRAVQCEDGRIRITGRLDGMQKLRGQRLEPREIEMEMESCPGVRRAAVQVRGEGRSAALCGWYTCQGKVDEEALREKLFRMLPAYMVPTHLMQVEEMPLNSSGKLDRSALPDIVGTVQPQDDGKGASSGRKTPDSLREETVCRCFQKALRMDRPVLRQENFFLLGGDSISALEMIHFLGQEGLGCSLNDVFRNPTPSALSRVVRAEKEKEESASFHGGIPEELIGCSKDQNVEALFPVCNSTLTYLMMDDYGITWRTNEERVEVILSRSFSEEEFRDRMRCLTQNHPALRSRFVRDYTGEYWQVFEKEKKSPLWYRDISALSSAAQRRFLSGFWQVMESEKALWKAACFPLGGQESALLLYARHTIMDGMSLQVCLNEFCSDGYRALLPDRFLQNRSRLTAEKEELSSWVRAYYANPDLSVKQKTMSANTGILTQTIRFSREETARITMRCLKAGITLFTWAQYCLGQALLAMYGTDELWMTHLDSGRGGDGSEAMRIIGNLFLPIPVRMRTGLSAGEFQEDLLRLRDCPAVSESRTLFSSGDWRNLPDGFTSGIFQGRDPMVRSYRMVRRKTIGRQVEMEDGCLILTLNHPDTPEQIEWNRKLKKRLQEGLKKEPV